MNPFFYRLFGYWIRRDACRLAAHTLKATDVEASYTPRLWSMTVFFEQYLCEGANGTADDFGPPDPVALKPVDQLTA